MMQIPNAYKTPLICSVIFHVLIMVIAAFGLPTITKKIDPPEPIKIIDVSLIAPKTNQSEQTPERSKPPKAKKAPPKMTADAPPDLSKQRDPIPDDKSQPQEPIETMPDDPAPKPRGDIKPPPQRPNITKKAPPKSENNEALQSLLKNLMDTPPESEESDEPEENETKPVPLDQQISISEIEAVRAQLAGCWTVLSGARYAEDLVVDIKLTMNRDATIQKAVIVDQGRYNRDAYFKAAADSAVRALYTPACKKLKLPEEKYDQWKTLTINFDPRNIL